MNKSLPFLICSLLLAIAAPSFAVGPGGDSMGNGGDLVADDFVTTARTVIQALGKLQLSPTLAADVQTLLVNVNVVIVHSSDGLQLSGVAVDAINYPATKQIMVDRTRWTQNPNTQSVDTKRLVLHEYLGVSGYDDSTYFISGSLVNAILTDDLKHYTYLQQSLVTFDQLLKSLMQSFQTTLQASDANTARSKVCESLSVYDNDSDVTYESLTLAAPTLQNDGFANLKQTLADLANYRMQIGFICLKPNQNPNQVGPFLSQIEMEVANMLNSFGL